MLWVVVCALAWGQSAPSTFDPPNLPVAPAALPAPPPSTEHIFLLQFDQDRNGVLTLEELPEPMRRRFDKADLNRDGVLDARELLVGPTRISREARKAEELRLNRGSLTKRTSAGSDQAVLFRVGTELLRRLDRNGDGWADGVELGSLLSQPGILFGDPKPSAPTPVPAPVVASLPTPFTVDPLARDNPRAATPSSPSPPLTSPMPLAPAGPPPAIAGVSSPVVASGESVASEAARPEKGAGAMAMPDAATILKHLDKNGNGQLDRDEAVDQLADNFDRLDKNGDGMLSEQEIKRGLFLARLLGIRPKQDPQTYRTQ